MAGDLEGQVGLVTGAGWSIGRETALGFAQRGARAMAPDVNITPEPRAIPAPLSSRAPRRLSISLSRSTSRACGAA